MYICVSILFLFFYILFPHLFYCSTILFFNILILFHHILLILLCEFDAQMSTFSSIHNGFADGSSWYTQNLSFVVWVVYSPTDELLSSRGIHLGHATNNFSKYCVVIGLLTKEISFNITQLIVNLDSQLVVFQLNCIYTICGPILY